MEEEEDDDIYGSPEADHEDRGTEENAIASVSAIKQEHYGSEQEEGEESDDASDSDIDIITEREPGAGTNVDTQQLRSESKPNIRASSSELPSDHKEAAPAARGKQSRPAANSQPGHEYPEVHSSKIEIEAVPVYEPVGKSITDLDFDVDLAEHDKPWRRPGAEQSDYFNYGFDEFTWATYCMKQKSMRADINEQKAESKQFEMMFGGQSNMGLGQPGAPTGPSHNNGVSQLSSMPGMPDLSPEMMNSMMQHMMASGMDMSQMGPMDLANMMQQMQGGMQANQVYGGGPAMLDQGHIQQNQAYGGAGRGRGRRGRWQ